MLTVRQGLLASLIHLLSSISRRLIGLVSLIVLARVLSPEDFGLVAIALIFLNFLESVTEIGGNSYVFSREKIDDQIIYTNWTMNLLIKGGAAVILAICAPFIAQYYDDGRLTPILLAFSLTVAINALVSPGVLEKHKRQEIGKLTAFNIAQRVVTAGCTIAIAMIFQTYWALVIGQMLNAVFQVSISYYVAPKKLSFSFTNVEQQWEFSKWLLPQSFLNFFKTQIDAMFVSSHFDKATMGGYNSMRYYAMIPSNMLIAPLTAPALTQLSEIKNNKDYFIKKLQVINLFQVALCVPLAFLMITYSTDIISLVLGEKWSEYAPLFAIFSGTVFIVNLYNYIANILMLNDKTKLLTMFTLGSVLLNIAMFYFVEFKTIFQLATYKIVLDLGLVVLFYFATLFKLFGIKSLIFITYVSIPPVLITLIIHFFTVGSITLNITSNFAFLGEIAIFTVLYGAITMGVCYSFSNKVYAYSYLSSLATRFLNKIVVSKLRRNS